MKKKILTEYTKCILGNSTMKGLKCPDSNTCCAFCDVKNCDVRCTDAYEKCKYLTDKIIDSYIPKVEEIKEIKPKSKRGRPKKVEVSIADIRARREAGRNI